MHSSTTIASTLTLRLERRRVLVVTADRLSERMAGPAIRAYEMAKALARVADVRLVSTASSTLVHDDFEISHASDAQMRQHELWADVIVFQGHLLATHPWLKKTEKLIVADIYDPMHLEVLEQGRYLPAEDRYHTSALVADMLSDQIARADFMVCASDKQRDFWLGHLGAMGRINPLTYDNDPTLRSLLDVVPFGVSDDAPVQRRHAIKGEIQGIGPDDKVILWGGGIYNWFDPLTLIRAVGKLSERHDDVRLFFMGVQHPNPDVPEMRMVVDAKELADELGLLNRVVFFNEQWVPYEQRADYLLDADIGVSTHLDKLETAFSFRTRILDYLWASLPIVSTEGDTFAEIVTQQRLGAVVPAGDVETLDRTLETVLFDDEEYSAISQRVGEFAKTMTWSRALVPLVRFCLSGDRAPDIAAGIPLAGSIEVTALRARVEGLEESSSWRLTAPFRWVAGAARKVLGRS